ncbi:hypothetical protein [Clostridium nigeriense]|uniref:hypothetical protein n=1 Tax=Clostridium nigeriense TaxID=1805470 RepID=UPI003D32DF55
MNKNVKALKNIEDKKNNTLVNYLITIFSIISIVINIYLSSKDINLVDFNASEYFINQILYYIKNIVSIFIVSNLYSFQQIKRYSNFYYLPISVDEFYIFFIQQHKNKFIIISITNLFSFLITTINLKLSILTLIFNILFLAIITFIIYYVVNILLSILLLNMPLKIYNNIIKIVFPVSVVINIIPSTSFEILSKYLNKHIFTSFLNLRVLLIVILLSLSIVVLKNIKSKLLKKIFRKSVMAEEQSRKYDKYISINKLKVTSPLWGYIKNEISLLKKGYFKLTSGLMFTIILYSSMLLSIIATFNTIELNDETITFIIIYSVSILVDISIFNYSLNSIFFMEDFIKWIKATCLNVLIYYRSKLLVKCILNSILFIIIIVSIYFILPIIRISNDKIIVQAIICYFNILIMSYFDNNLDFRYQIFYRDINIKVYITKIKKYTTFLLGKISIITIQLIIYNYLLKNIYGAIIFSYVLIAITIYFFRENIFIHIPIKRSKRKERYIKIDDLI